VNSGFSKRLTLLPIFFGLGSLPLTGLFALSGGLRWVIFRLLKYRRSVIRANLKASFPERSPAEIEGVAQKFESFFADFLFELLKLFRWSPQQITHHVHTEGIELIEELTRQKKSLILALGHFGNWEMVIGSYAHRAPFEPLLVYHPVTHTGLDAWMHWMRVRWGNRLIPMQEATRAVRKRAQSRGSQDAPFAVTLAADQSPRPERAYWTRFLNQETAFFRGVGRLAREHDLAVVYIHVLRPKRGQYHIRFEELALEPQSLTEDDIIERFVKKLEANIREQPEIWLWSHRRWKSKRPAITDERR
jgi:KDO2-lipid IV(A) lauroyltransferase